MGSARIERDVLHAAGVRTTPDRNGVFLPKVGESSGCLRRYRFHSRLDGQLWISALENDQASAATRAEIGKWLKQEILVKAK